MRRCTRCVLPEICPKITFDATGTCNVCAAFSTGRWAEFHREHASRRRELSEILEHYRGRGGDYDVLVPVSGGLDSTYALYLCRTVFNLRPLAFNFDNGFQTRAARRNLEHAASILGVELVTAGPAWETLKTLYRIFFLKTGEFCTPCNMGIWATSYQVAQEHEIPLIVSGASDRLRERLPEGGRIYQWSPAYFRAVISGDVQPSEVETYGVLPDRFHEHQIRSRAHMSTGDQVHVLPLPDFVEWEYMEILRNLERELDWKQRGGEYHHIDCVMQPVSDYLKQRRWGFSAAIWYSMLVRNGQMTRAEALRRTRRDEAKSACTPPELAKWMEQLDLTVQDLDTLKHTSQRPYL